MIEERYEIIKLLGKGRTGGIYEAEDTNLGRKVAMRRFFAQNQETDLSEYKDDFEKVAHSLSALQHPNLLRVYDAGFDHDGAYIISQLLQGETLHNKLKSEAIPAWEVNDLAQQMLDALSTAHKEGFVHGAITPGSILMSPRARGGYLYVILDMGLSRLAPLIQGKDSVLSIMADPAILAPELFGDAEATERSDLYMLGHILYMCLAGGHPFGGVSAEEAEKMHHAGLPSLLGFNADVPEEFRLWIEHLTQVNPDNRPASAVDALNALPKVQRPAKAHSAEVYTATAHLSSGSAAQLQSPAGDVTGPLSSFGVAPSAPSAANTGPLSSVMPANPAGAGAGVAAPGLTLPSTQQKSSKKALYLILGLVATIGAVVVAISLSGGGDEGGSTGKVADASADTANSYAERNAVAAEKVIFTDFDGAKAEESDWKFAAKGQQEVVEALDGWNINTNGTKTLPGIKFPLKATENDMFDLGWKLTYVVRPVKGQHRLGFNISEKMNPGWEGEIVSLYLSVERTADGNIMISALNSGNTVKAGKSITVPYPGAAGWNSISIEQKPEAEAGDYTVFVDGKEAFSDTFTEGKSFNHTWNEHLFSSAFSKDIEAQWVIKQIKFETL